MSALTQVARPMGAVSDYKQAEAKALEGKIEVAKEELARRDLDVQLTLTKLKVKTLLFHHSG